jgi:hypothetical protein
VGTKLPFIQQLALAIVGGGGVDVVGAVIVVIALVMKNSR